MSDNSKFFLKLEKLQKTVYASVSGDFGPEDANDFVVDYTKIVKSIDPKEYDLKFDCTKLKVTANNMTEMLQACLEMYKNDGFKSVVFDCTGNVVMGMQLRRLGNSVGLQNFDIVK